MKYLESFNDINNLGKLNDNMMFKSMEVYIL